MVVSLDDVNVADSLNRDVMFRFDRSRTRLDTPIFGCITEAVPTQGGGAVP